MSSSFTASTVIDLNQDGLTDVVHPSTYDVNVSAVGPTGTLTALARITRVNGPTIALDLDADGDQDLAIHDASGKSTTEYLTDPTGGLHEQGPAFQPRYLHGRTGRHRRNG